MINGHDAGQEHLTAAEASEWATRRWLEEAWRHGEVVADEDRPWMVTPVRPVDRFMAATEPPGVDAPEHDHRAGPEASSLAGTGAFVIGRPDGSRDASPQ